MQIRALAASDAPSFRALRLRALREHPEAFTSSHDEDEKLPIAATVQRLAANERAGFCSFGIEPDAIRVDGRSFCKNHMYLELAAP
jgi:hypothetical protein